MGTFFGAEKIFMLKNYLKAVKRKHTLIDKLVKNPNYFTKRFNLANKHLKRGHANSKHNRIILFPINRLANKSEKQRKRSDTARGNSA